MTKKEVVKSVQYNDQNILTSIRDMFLDGENFDLDPCYSSGKFYDGIDQPVIKMDLYPESDEIIQNNIIDGIPLDDKSIKGIVFDPPFMFGKHGKTDEYQMTKRFTMFDNWEDLVFMYQSALSEFYRILEKHGIVAFKCQDYTDSKTTLTHCYIHNWAIDAGFKTEDLFINVHECGRIWNSRLTQRHARKFHTYWMVFKK